LNERAEKLNQTEVEDPQGFSISDQSKDEMGVKLHLDPRIQASGLGLAKH
jgi:hypothetical protein